MADTSVTVQTEINNSLARAKNPLKDPWTDSMMLKFWNKGMRFVYQLLVRLNSEIGITAGTITMAATQEYTLSGNLDDFWVMSKNGVYFADNDPLTQVSLEDKVRQGSDTTDDLPTMFYLTSTALGLVKIPTATAVAVDDTLNCRYFKYQADLVIGANCPWKNIFNDAITAFADSMAFLQNEVSGTTELMAIYNTLEGSTLEIIKKRDG